MTDKKGLPRPPLFTSDYITMAEILNFALDRFGKLVLALMHYTENETLPKDLPPELSAMFKIYQKKIDAAREKYNKKCAVLAANGSKGGKAKAVASGSSHAKFNPPTKKQFDNAVQHFIDNDEIPDDISDYSIDRLYESLAESCWKIDGEPIQSRNDWEAVILANFIFDFTVSQPVVQLYWAVFKHIFSTYHGLRDHDGNTKADDTTAAFLDEYREDTKGWEIAGKHYGCAQWQEAVNAFIENNPP